MRRFTLVIASLFVTAFAVPQISNAQVRGGMRAGGGAAVINAPRPMANAGPGFRSAPPAGGTTVFRGNTAGRPLATGSRGTAVGGVGARIVNRPGNSAAAFNRQNSVPDFTGVPGLGFDYAHLAAVHPQGSQQHGFRHRNNNVGFFPFFDSGFLLPYSSGYLDGPDDNSYADNTAPPPPQQQSSADVAGDTQSLQGHESRYGLQAVAPYDVVVTPPKQSEQYVFVRRDGSVFFAVAYSWEPGNLLYVTQEGYRRTVSRDMLDLAATQQFNEQRGLSFQSPA